MTPHDLNQLWNDALDDVPTEPVAEPLWQHVQQRLRVKRRRRLLVRGAVVAVVALVAMTLWFRPPTQSPEIARSPVPNQPAHQTLPTPPVVAQLPVSAPVPTTPPVVVKAPQPPEPAPAEPNRLVIKSVSLHDFLAQLPHHGTVEIRNKRGRFLVIVDNETGETFTSELSPDDQL